MPLHKMKQKKFKGIYEYYKASDQDKATTAYYVSVRDAEGKPKKIKADANTAEEAVVFLARYKHTRTLDKKKSVSHTTVNKATTLDKLATLFFSQRNTSNNKKDTRKYEMHVSSLMGSMNIHTIGKKHIKALQDTLVSKELLQPKTINIITDLTYAILNWAFSESYVSVQIPKITKLTVDNARSRVFTDDEMALIFDNLEGDALMLVTIMYYTAVRPESALRLKKRDIYGGHLNISSIKNQEPHKIPISSKLATKLDPWVDGLDNDDYIISKSRTKPKYSTLSTRIGKKFFKMFNSEIDRKADMKHWASLYTLRHTSLTNIYKHTGDVYLTQKIANHSDIRMTERYSKVNDIQKRNAIEGL